MDDPLPADPGLYRRFNAPRAGQSPAVFLDRDGVLVEEVGYLHRVQDIEIISATYQALAALEGRGLPVVLVTNQAGIGRGYYGWKEFDQVQDALRARLAPLSFSGVWACAYHPEAGIDALRQDHPWRKPHPGMLVDAAAALNLDLGRSWLAGDKILDMEAAINAGLAGAVLVRTGYGAAMEKLLPDLPPSRCQIHVADNVGGAVELICSRIGLPSQPSLAGDGRL